MRANMVFQLSSHALLLKIDCIAEQQPPRFETQSPFKNTAAPDHFPTRTTTISKFPRTLTHAHPSCWSRLVCFFFPAPKVMITLNLCIVMNTKRMVTKHIILYSTESFGSLTKKITSPNRQCRQFVQVQSSHQVELRYQYAMLSVNGDLIYNFAPLFPFSYKIMHSGAILSPFISQAQTRNRWWKRVSLRSVSGT